MQQKSTTMLEQASGGDYVGWGRMNGYWQGQCLALEQPTIEETKFARKFTTIYKVLRYLLYFEWKKHHFLFLKKNYPRYSQTQHELS